MKKPKHPAHRRALLKSMLDNNVNEPSRTALGNMMHGYKLQGDKPSTGARPKPRAHLVRMKSSGVMGSLDNSIDKMIASALVGGPHTTGVLSSLFGLTPNLTGR